MGGSAKKEGSVVKNSARKVMELSIKKAASALGKKIKEIPKLIPDKLITLRKVMARPPGTHFMGAQPTSVKAWLGEYGKNPQIIILIPARTLL